MPQKKKGRLLRFWREFAKPFVVLLAVVGSCRSAVADWNDVPTPSMNPTIVEGDRIFVNKLAYDLRVPFTNWRLAHWGSPQRGDVVILFSPADETRLVKRVVGVPGDRIALHNNRLLVNGEPASYEPLEPAVSGIIGSTQQPGHRFARERIGTASHPIMLTPSQPARSSFRPITVPEGHYFVMGDNRDNSRDSRYFGFVEEARIVGRVTRVALSFDPSRYYWPRWHRFLKPLP
jgi:signal peptidase I